MFDHCRLGGRKYLNIKAWLFFSILKADKLFIFFLLSRPWRVKVINRPVLLWIITSVRHLGKNTLKLQRLMQVRKERLAYPQEVIVILDILFHKEKMTDVNFQYLDKFQSQQGTRGKGKVKTKTWPTRSIRQMSLDIL